MALTCKTDCSTNVPSLWSLSAIRFTTKYDLTDSSWVSIWFWSRVFSFYYIDGSGGRHNTVSQNFLVNLMHWFSWTWFIGLVCCIKCSPPFYLSFRSVDAFITIFIVYFSCYLPSTKPGLRYLYSCSYTNKGCPVIEVNSF
jgi:hypothetical protein